jgi:lysophospholipase L1-like esterase
MTRILCLAFVGLFNVYVVAQSSPTADIDKMMQEMLHLSAEQRAQLRAVEVPINAEKKFGDRVFEAFQQQLKLQKNCHYQPKPRCQVRHSTGWEDQTVDG